VAEWVFAYGSLVARPGAVPAVLREHRRFWGVAMDNREAIPGYKVYEAPDGARPAVYVAFVDVEPAPGRSVDGVLLAVDAAELARLDARERNYRRVDVSGSVDAPGRVWTYQGSEAGRERLRRGRALRCAVVQEDYACAVPEPPDLPVMALRRVDLPA
jgi:gamma-glutamylcyclotransferase (GGCT)/AIG2-like uncharacterized protein YtfP